MSLVLEKAFEHTGLPIKALARALNYDEQMIYKAKNGTRNLPPVALKKISQLSMGAGMEISFHITGYSFFKVHEGDRHIQALIRRVEKEDYEADMALKELPWILIDKEPEDLTSEDVAVLRSVEKEFEERVNSELNLLMAIKHLRAQAEKRSTRESLAATRAAL